MSSIQIRNLDATVLEALKRRAKRHHRSLQGELHAILETAVRQETIGEEGALELVTVDTGRSSTFTREDIYEDDIR